jgi:hypothetical protein
VCELPAFSGPQIDVEAPSHGIASYVCRLFDDMGKLPVGGTTSFVDFDIMSGMASVRWLIASLDPLIQSVHCIVFKDEMKGAEH